MIEQNKLTEGDIEIGTFLTKEKLPTMGIMIQTAHPVIMKEKILENQEKLEKIKKWFDKIPENDSHLYGDTRKEFKEILND